MEMLVGTLQGKKCLPVMGKQSLLCKGNINFLSLPTQDKAKVVLYKFQKKKRTWIAHPHGKVVLCLKAPGLTAFKKDIH